MSAVNSIRQLDAHKANDSKTRLDRALTDLGVQPNAISNNYANAIWQVYDSIDEMFANLNIFLSKPLTLNNYHEEWRCDPQLLFLYIKDQWKGFVR